MDTKKPAVPKFASFKPKAEDPSKSQSPPPNRLDKDRSRSHRDRDLEEHERHRSSRHTKQPRSHHRRPPSRSPERRPAQPTPAPRGDPLYVIDNRGDPLIVRYGANERSRVPAYRRAGAGRVMGGEGRLRILYDGNRALFSLGDRLGEGPSAFRDRALLSKASRRKTRVFRLRSEPDQKQTQPLGDEVDFLPLSESSKPRDTKVDGDEIPGGEEPNYRSIQGKAKARDFVDSDLESADSSDSEAEADLDASNPTRLRYIELSRCVKDQPGDIEAWIELVDLQEDLLQLNETLRQDRTTDEAKGLASIRVSLLEEALPHASNKADKERLLLRLMREGSKVWSSKALAKRWTEISLKDSSFALWKAHLDHELSNMSTFTYGGRKQMQVDRLNYLEQSLSEAIHSALASHEGEKLEGICHSHSDISDSLVRIYEEFVGVFLRVTCFIRDAGYSELAVAAWQAVLELTFARPTDETDTDPTEAMASLRDFWESEVPRIGETGAMGWRLFTEAEEMADLPEAKVEAALVNLQTRDVYKAWAAAETQKSRNASLPARTLDEGTEEDPFRVVMFDDLKALLFYIPSALVALPKVRADTLNGFLLFCQLPAASLGTGDIIRDLCNDPFVYSESVDLEPKSSGQGGDDEDGTKKPPNFSDPGRRMVESPDVVFAGSDWFGFFNRDASPAYDLALAVTTQLATSFGYEPIAEYSMGLAWNKNPSTIRKAAKALLKKWPNSTALYNAYVVAEWRNRNQDVARNVLLSATSQDLPEKERLWTTWAWLGLEASDMKGALARCVAATGDAQQDDTESTTTYSQLLKARQTLSSSREFLVSVGNICHATLRAETSILLEYLSPCVGSTKPMSSRQGDIEAAINILHTFTSELVTRGYSTSPHLERLHQLAAHLLYHHSARGPFRPTYLRSQLQHSITLFPSNTLFLSLFAWADTSLLLNDPVRSLLRTLAKTHDSLPGRLFAIQHELRTASGSVHSVRTTFERALDGDAGGGSNPGLWRAYLRFGEEYQRELRGGGGGGKGVAKDVYYRAIAVCPWSKDLAMEAFTTLGRDMESGELRSVWNNMVTKGLRVCVDLEEFGAKWKERRGG